MREGYIGQWQGIRVIPVPDNEFQGDIKLPERLIKYLEESEEIRRKYFGIISDLSIKI